MHLPLFKMPFIKPRGAALTSRGALGGDWDASKPLGITVHPAKFTYRLTKLLLTFRNICDLRLEGNMFQRESLARQNPSI